MIKAVREYRETFADVPIAGALIALSILLATVGVGAVLVSLAFTSVWVLAGLIAVTSFVYTVYVWLKRAGDDDCDC